MDQVPWIPKLLCIVLLSLIAMEWLLGLKNLLTFNPGQVRLFAAQASAPNKVPVQPTPAVILPLFGDALTIDAHDITVEFTPLKLNLVGILYAPLQEDCEVIVQMPDKQEHIFHVGDTLIEGATLKQVQRDEIFIIRQGRIERLSLPEKGLRFDPPAKPLGEQ